MIITRTPLRITLGGGGTDLPSYYGEFGGLVISAAINKYIYITLNRTFTDDYFLKYAELERVRLPQDVTHPIIREALCSHAIEPGVELVSTADIPAGTGLGSSGTFTVGLLKALYAHRRVHVTAANLADEACAIEIDRLGRPVGKQDQYIAAFGGLTCFEFEKDGHVRVSPLMISNETLHDLETHLLMFFTGYSRDADTVLSEQKQKSEASDRDMLENLHTVKELGVASKEALERGDTQEFAALMHTHWTYKRERSRSMSNDAINEWYEAGRSAGAIGGKLVGAGGGGFLLFYAPNPADVRDAMRERDLQEVRFAFDHDGATVIVRG